MHPPHSVDEEAEDVELAALERDDGPLRRQELGLRAVQRQLHTRVLQGRHSMGKLFWPELRFEKSLEFWSDFLQTKAEVQVYVRNSIRQQIQITVFPFPS